MLKVKGCRPIALHDLAHPALMVGLTRTRRGRRRWLDAARFQNAAPRHDILLVQRLALPAQGIDAACTSTVRERGT